MALATLLGLSASTSFAQTGRQRGATLGGLAGAVAGGLIGDNSNEAGAGAGIGAVVGAVAGGILGDAADKDRAIAQQQRYYRNQQLQYQQQQALANAQLSAVTMNDVISMSKSGLSEMVIINQVQQRGFSHQLQVSDIITLHENGVCENVITALQRAPDAEQIISPPVPSPPVYVQRPVVVEQPVVVERPVVVQPSVIHHRIVPAPVVIRPTHVGPSRYHYHNNRYRRSSHSSLNIRF